MPGRTADPMSLSSIMSGNDDEPAARYSAKQSQDSRRSSLGSGHHVPLKLEHAPSPTLASAPLHVTHLLAPSPQEHPVTNGVIGPDHSATLTALHARSKPDEREIEAELARIDAMDISDPDSPGFEDWKEEYRQRGLKRQLQVAEAEAGRRKVRSSPGFSLCFPKTNYPLASTRLLSGPTSPWL